jgi:hypothetical protein
MADSASAADYADALRRALVPSTPDEVARGRAMARQFDWSEVVPRIREVYGRAIRGYGQPRGEAAAVGSAML